MVEPDRRIRIGVTSNHIGASNMNAVVRSYSGAGAKQLFDLLEARKAEVEAVIRKVPGLVSYTLLRSGDGGVSVTVCQDKAGADESVKVARDWIQENAAWPGVPPGSNIGASAPVVTEGSVIVQVNG
jgi:hypothetical protein